MTTTKLPRETADALCMTISSDDVAYASNILKPSGRHPLDIFSIWLKPRLHLQPNGTGLCLSLVRAKVRPPSISRGFLSQG
ncbi:uncharacterized protein FFUJ_09039 [Fusarium fujikuroi IMI 58289]|uniref:Uncharacterized protein n=1 Tax=Gibberella fujikuroi (strain CBS 195.34 / IMI 58289 / NRRL A-6831) TaxID=1279085 RepID=S0E7Q6_GIBF5|nr:uncharacterized protein FFUJ_09039 [Fusarium fujikuroi IMI 58289]KLP21987.1 uncharacterized protein LW94_7135 [Fusarium fujikuroi]CCT70934.1 uncharacterized protein FFUJ_09039 [Fusarium fujikuroi IMI 58289]SCO02644.1 uncharacterized protein FFM5_07922 [Fusarium fujikuroi]SCO53001.1 uncharacterized protein FFMR_11320 [Fusarium fujikuroi]